jgi:hypothetical protein
LGEPVDVYICPAVRNRGAKGRRKGDALPPTVCWVDLDGAPKDPALFGLLVTAGAYPVRSGSGENLHLYLPLLDGRRAVDEEDWQLAAVLWQTSCAVRDTVTEHAAAEKARQAELVAEARVQLAERTAAAVDGLSAKLDRLATTLAQRVIDAGGMQRGEARKGLAGRDRHLYDQVVERAVASGLLVRVARQLQARPVWHFPVRAHSYSEHPPASVRSLRYSKPDVLLRPRLRPLYDLLGCGTSSERTLLLTRPTLHGDVNGHERGHDQDHDQQGRAWMDLAPRRQSGLLRGLVHVVRDFSEVDPQPYHPSAGCDDGDAEGEQDPSLSASRYRVEERDHHEHVCSHSDDKDAGPASVWGSSLRR